MASISITTHSILKDLIEASAGLYFSQICAVGIPTKKAELFRDGYKDGAWGLVKQLDAMKLLKVVEDDA